MMLAVTIAPAEPGDFADVVVLFREYAAALDVDLSRQGFEQELARLPGAYAPPHGALLLARGKDGASLGCVALRRLDERACEMKRLYVNPQARGTGLGGALVGAAVAEAARLGYREMKLDTLPNLKGAIALYRQFGFQPISPYGEHPYEGTLCFGRIV